MEFIRIREGLFINAVSEKKNKFKVFKLLHVRTVFPSPGCVSRDMRAASLVNLKHILVPRGRALLGQHQESRPLIGWEYETNVMRMLRKSALARNHRDSWCRPKEARSLVFYVYLSQTYKTAN